MRLSLMALMAHLCWRLHTGKRLCSEEQLQAELNLSGRCGGCSDEACRGVDCASGKYNRIGNTEVCMVESVEEFRPELYVRFFRHDDIFKQRQVHLHQAGPAKSSPSQIPHVPTSGKINAFGSNHWVCFPSNTGPEKDGFSDGRSGFRVFPSPDRLVPICGVKGKPLNNVAIPFSCQPLMILFPLPNGSS